MNADSNVVVRVFLAGPSDVADELDVAQQVVTEWNKGEGFRRSIVVQPVSFFSHGNPGSSGSPQDEINRDLVDRCDIIAAFFRTRFGMALGGGMSATEEEIRRSISSQKQVLVYFFSGSVPTLNLDIEQLGRVQGFMKEYQQDHVYWTYSSLDALRADFYRHLGISIDKFLASESHNLHDATEVDKIVQDENEDIVLGEMGRLDHLADIDDAIRDFTITLEELESKATEFKAQMETIPSAGNMRSALNLFGAIIGGMALQVGQTNSRMDQCLKKLEDTTIDFWQWIREDGSIEDAIDLRDRLTAIEGWSAPVPGLADDALRMANHMRRQSAIAYRQAVKLHQEIDNLRVIMETGTGFATSLIEQVDSWVAVSG